jgi:hypothetical protein
MKEKVRRNNSAEAMFERERKMENQKEVIKNIARKIFKLAQTS